MAKAYPFIYDEIENQLGRQRLNRFSVSGICDHIRAFPPYQHLLINMGLHWADAAQALEESLPSMVTGQIRKHKRPIYLPEGMAPGRKNRVLCRRRVYLGYQHYGAWFYQHFDGIGPEVGEMMLRNVRRNRQRVQLHERWLEFALHQMTQQGFRGVEVDWDRVVIDLEDAFPDTVLAG